MSDIARDSLLLEEEEAVDDVDMSLPCGSNANAVENGPGEAGGVEECPSRASAMGRSNDLRRLSTSSTVIEKLLGGSTSKSKLSSPSSTTVPVPVAE